jgi:hypothetical protein
MNCFRIGLLLAFILMISIFIIVHEKYVIEAGPGIRGKRNVHSLRTASNRFNYRTNIRNTRINRAANRTRR